eukprot:TRINITY_DN1505_c0_g1_i1.p1 TRINITY_DN1505_c0_g1~~TRINITY_DN1505_c0_g1_i1.p1  ORF type:complete len:158 (+),score=40.09 TRINITY_DN1505_c0_g1_i1:336-809(+)
MYTCEGELDCPFGQYCDQPRRRCLPSIPLGQRLEANCVGKGTIGDEQCGLGMKCLEDNPLEKDEKLKRFVCKWESGGGNQEGERCERGGDCVKGTVCSTLFRPETWGACIAPDYAHLGEGCDGDSDCGRGLLCQCPEYGDANGGRKRCVVNPLFKAF